MMNELEKIAERISFLYEKIVDNQDWEISELDELLDLSRKDGIEWQSKQSPWIRVEDRLPDAEIMGTNCRVLVKTFDCTHVVYDVSTVVFMSKRGFISHWMPIPE